MRRQGATRDLYPNQTRQTVSDEFRVNLAARLIVILLDNRFDFATAGLRSADFLRL